MCCYTTLRNIFVRKIAMLKKQLKATATLDLTATQKTVLKLSGKMGMSSASLQNAQTATLWLMFAYFTYTQKNSKTKVCRYGWHSAGSLGWPFPMLKYK